MLGSDHGKHTEKENCVSGTRILRNIINILGSHSAAYGKSFLLGYNATLPVPEELQTLSSGYEGACVFLQNLGTHLPVYKGP
jgi:hypothetical protein